MSNVLSYLTCFGWLPLFLMGLLGLILGFLLSKLFGKGHSGDLTAEGEGALRQEADGLRARIRELEGKVASGDAEASSLKSKLAAAGAGAVAGAGAASLAGGASGDSGTADDDSYALEWRNRYLAARVKYLEGRLAEAPKASAKKAPAKKKASVKKTTSSKKKSAAKAGAAAAAAGGATLAATSKKKAPVKKKVSAKKPAAKKPAAKKAPAKKKAAPKKASATKVLYTDGPTDGKPDDLKLIKGIGPKFEKDLNSKGIYYFRQIGNWKAGDVKMVEGVIDSIPGRIKRDEWVKQAKGLSKGAGATAKKKAPAKKAAAKKPPAKKAPAKKAAGNDNSKYYEGVRRFHKSAKTGTIDNVVKYLGASLKNRDSALVACSDPTEMATVAKNFGMKKLGLSKEAAEKAAADTCAEMKPVRQKNRAVFYYLMAKRVKQLSFFEK